MFFSLHVLIVRVLMSDAAPAPSTDTDPQDPYWKVSNGLRDVLDLSDTAARAGDLRDAADTIVTALAALAPALAVLAALARR